ncbi:MAG: hypothetical protein MK110_07500 [Fuerstiella sp.]|nr:hypothetical protein [Fuerstiella sp.]
MKPAFLSICVGLTLAVQARCESPPYRTDGGDEKLAWYQLKPGEFPPADAAHSMGISLLTIHPPGRRGEFREKANLYYKAPITSFALLPAATVRRHGAPADLRDFSPGAHVWVGAFQNQDRQKFHQIWTLSDDFSRDVATGSRWEVTALNLDRRRVTLVRVTAGQKEKPRDVVVDPRTTFWKGTGFGNRTDLAVGRQVLVNFGPGTVSLPFIDLLTDVWLDEESVHFATERQSARTLFELRRRGLPVRVDAVNNHDPELTLTFMDPGFPGLLDLFVTGKICKIAVADSALRTYQPAGGQGGPDSFNGKIIAHREVPKVQGCAGLQIVVKPKYLVEGFRPGRSLRLMDEKSNFQILPPEERRLKNWWD